MNSLVNDLIDQQQKTAAVSKIKPKNSASLRNEILELVSKENSRVPAERQITQRAALTVAARSLNRTAGLEKRSRMFAAYREVAAFVALAIDGRTSNGLTRHRDLLPIAHPLSSQKHSMSASAYLSARARWIAADPSIDDSVREIVASAYESAPGSVERQHALARLSSLTAGLVPREFILSPLVAAFSFGDGNSSAARSARAKLQWRDRLGRWIEMGRGIGFKINLPGGAASAIGRFVGMGSTPDTGLVQITGDKNLPDGIYPIKSNNAEAFKAILTDKQVGGLGSKLSQLLDARANIPTLEELKSMRMDAPEGWTKNNDGSFTSDDNYVVKGKDGAFELYREDKNGDLGEKVGDAKGWAEVQDLANNDQKSYDEYKRIVSHPSNADALPGMEKDPYDNLPAGTKAFLKEQADKKAADEKFFEDKKKKYNEDVDKFEAMIEQGKDIEGRDIPPGWEFAVKKYGSGPDEIQIRSFQKIVPSKDGTGQVQVIAEVGDDGKIHFGHRASWFNKDEQGFEGYDTWAEAEAQIPRVVDWVGNSKVLMHDPADPWYKDAIPVPQPDNEKQVAEIPSSEPTTPVEEKPSAPAAEFDPKNFDVPEGAYKLNVASFEPEGRVDEVSKDFTDDPKVLANKFTDTELESALSQALIGTKDYVHEILDELNAEPSDDEEAPAAKSKPGPKPKSAPKSTNATGYGLLDFNAGEEFVPAEAIYLALKEQGANPDELVATLYDSKLGQPTNTNLLNDLNKQEDIKALAPSVVVDNFDLDPNIFKAHRQIAEPQIAQVATMQMDEMISKPEDNKALIKIADDIKNLDAPQGYTKVLDDNIDLAFSDNPDDNTAFRGLWGLLLSLDGGATDGSEETDLSNAVYSSIAKYKGSDPKGSEMADFYDKFGYYDEFIQSKIDIAQGRAAIDTPDSTAGAFYRLVAQISGPNEQDLYRGISFNYGSTMLDAYTNPGEIISIDPRSFSDDKITAGNFANAFTSNDSSSIIFTIPKGQGQSVNLTNLSMFTDEREHLAWGDYRIAEVKSKDLPGNKKLYNVKLEAITKRDALLEGQGSDYSSFLLNNEEVSLPDGYYSPSVDAYIPQFDENSDTPDNPLYVARAFDNQDLIDSFIAGVEDGSGKAVLDYNPDEGQETTVDLELIRDALQIQGTDTNQILNDIANAGPDAKAVPAEPTPVDANFDNPIDEISNDIATEYDMQGWKKVGPQLGSNEGGFYEDPDGNRFYVKTPKSDLHAQNEVLASALYRALGIDAAEIYLASADDGKIKTISPDIIGSKQDLESKLNDKEYISKLQDGFAVDAWLANWDVAGLVFDNVMSDGNGDPVRVDPGGALLYRAMGAPKGSLFGSEVSELDTLRDKNMNPQSSKIFGSMTEEQQKESARHLLDINPDEIGQLVDSVITEPGANQKLKDTLVARRQYILDRYGLLADDTSNIAQNTDVTLDEKTPSAPETPETRLETLLSWADEYQGDAYQNYPSDNKQLAKISEQIDGILVDYRNGDITDAQLPDTLNELRNFIDSYNWKGGTETLNNVEDLTDQIDAIIEDVTPKVETPAETPTPSAPETPAVPSESPDNPYVTSDGVPIEPGMKLAYKKTGEVVDFIKYDKGNSSYVYVQFPGEKKPKVKSTKQLVSVKGDGGGGQGPKAPEAPESPEPSAPEAPTPETPNAPVEEPAQSETDIGQFNPTAELTPDGKKVRVSFIVDGNRPFNPNSDTGPNSYEEALPYAVDSKLDVDGVDEVTVEVPLDKMDDFAKTYKEVLGEKLVPEEFYGDIYNEYKTNKEAAPAENTAAAEKVSPPEGAVTASDANGNVIWAGVEVTDKTGSTGVVTKVNKDGYAFVKFPDGTTKWRSAKTLAGTGNVKEGVAVSPKQPKLSKKATGAGVAPVKVEKPSDWATSEFDAAPSVSDAMAKVMDTSEKGAGARGASAVVDSDSIEDLDVRFMHVYDENGVDGIQAKFKLTNWAAKKKVKEILAMTPEERKANGIEVDNLSIQKMTIDENGVGHIDPKQSQLNTTTGLTYTIRTADGVVIRIHRANKDDSNNFKSSYAYGKAPKAFHNLVTIQAPANATPETIANALGMAGVADVRPATPADARILIENRLMSIFDAQTDANVNLKDKQREESLARVESKWGITPDDVVITTGASGRIETRLSPEGAQKIWEATGKPAAIFHHTSIPYLDGDQDKKIDWLVNLFTGPQGGLLSTSVRWTEGIGVNGMSSSEDIGTGGAEYVFTKPIQNASVKEYGLTGTNPHILFDPLKIYQRLDFYANQNDAFGKRTKNKDVISAARVGAYEVMFKHRMSWNDLDVVVMSPTVRSAFLGKLKEKGITQIGGRPVEEVFVIGTKEQGA